MPNHITNVIVASPQVIHAITREHTPEEHAAKAAEEAKVRVNYKTRTGNDWPYPEEGLPERHITFADFVPEPERMFHGGCDSKHPHPHPDGGFYDACWYDWNVRNWGTKWDAYDQSIEPVAGDLCKLQFDTAWSHPAPVMEAIAKKVANEFPGEVLLVEYADEDLGSNVGTYRIVDGEFLDINQPDYGPESLELAARIKHGITYAEYKAQWEDED